MVSKAGLVRSTELDLESDLWYESPEQMFLLGRCPWDLLVRENLSIRTVIHSTIVLNLFWAYFHLNLFPALESYLLWSSPDPLRPKLISAHLSVSLSWESVPSWPLALRASLFWGVWTLIPGEQVLCPLLLYLSVTVGWFIREGTLVLFGRKGTSLAF